MKRDSRGIPVSMVQRWSRPSLSCQPCKLKKRRCDRNQPCSSCSLRDIQCEYGREGRAEPFFQRQRTAEATSSTIESNQTTVAAIHQLEVAPCDTKEMLARIRTLEEAVFSKSKTSVASSNSVAGHGETNGNNTTFACGALFGSHVSLASSDDSSPDSAFMTHLIAQLPPLEQATELFNHFSIALHPTLGVLHLPSVRALMESTYQGIIQGDQHPCLASLLMLFTIFAAAALTWTPQILERLRSTQEGAIAAFKAYTRLAVSILDITHQSTHPSTVTLAAIYTLAFVLSNTDASPIKAHFLRSRCVVIARMMHIDRLDMDNGVEKPNFQGQDMIEIEVQRRIWWHMVASDWLGAFSGSPQEGAYMFQPRHMNVNYPSNTDDEFITAAGIQHKLPLSSPTSMSAFLQRLKLADLCREIVDTMPSAFIGSQQPEYDIILALDDKLQTYLKELPMFFQLDPISIQKSQNIFKTRPDIPWQRVGIHFSLHARLCRLHRPYHLTGSTDPRYSYSRSTCIRSAHTILELRRSMDELVPLAGVRPARSWTVMQHVFSAALTLATEVAFNPDAPGAEAQRAKVMAAYRMLEKSQEESSALVDGIQKNMQTIMSTLQKRCTVVSSAQPEEPLETTTIPPIPLEGVLPQNQAPQTLGGLSIIEDDKPELDCPIPARVNTQGSRYLDEVTGDQTSLDQLWSEFVAAAPDLNYSDWTSLLDDIDLSFQPNTS